MDEEQFGTTADYLLALDAIRAEGIAKHHDRLLRAHLAAPGYAASLQIERPGSQGRLTLGSGS